MFSKGGDGVTFLLAVLWNFDKDYVKLTICELIEKWGLFLIRGNIRSLQPGATGDIMFYMW